MMRMLIAMLCLLFANTALATKVIVFENEQSGLLTYSAEDEGFSLELIQVIPDFIRAIYGKHDFPKSEIDVIAGYCVFGSVLKNTSNKTMHYDVANWYYTQNGKQHAIKTKTQWLTQWRKAGVVFSWTLLPDKGEFYEGDWQQGFTTIKAARNSKFDLTFTWQLDGVSYVGKIPDIQCPPATIEADQQ